jgi:hypothetical protein
VGISYRPNKALSLSLSPTYTFNLNQLQYITTQDQDDGKKYIFARIDQETMGLTCRLNLSLTPDLSIQLYGQPFISSGGYSKFKRITDSRAQEYTDRFHSFTDDEIEYDPAGENYSIDEDLDGVVDYSFGKPDFNFLQFRMNLVARWEYIPGSTLYVVWTQGRTDTLSLSDFSITGGMQDLFHIHPHNIFLIKFSYCFQL